MPCHHILSRYPHGGGNNHISITVRQSTLSFCSMKLEGTREAELSLSYSSMSNVVSQLCNLRCQLPGDTYEIAYVGQRRGRKLQRRLMAPEATHLIEGSLHEVHVELKSSRVHRSTPLWLQPLCTSHGRQISYMKSIEDLRLGGSLMSASYEAGFPQADTPV